MSVLWLRTYELVISHEILVYDSKIKCLELVIHSSTFHCLESGELSRNKD